MLTDKAVVVNCGGWGGGRPEQARAPTNVTHSSQAPHSATDKEPGEAQDVSDPRQCVRNCSVLLDLETTRKN